MPERTRRILKWLLGSGVALCCVVLIWKVIETNHYRNALPLELETSGFATTGSDMNLIVALIPMRHEGVPSFA